MPSRKPRSRESSIKMTADCSLPLPEESPQDFRMLPEYLFENVADYIEFLSRWVAFSSR